MKKRNRKHKKEVERKLMVGLTANKEFFIRSLQQEWDEILKGARREEIVRRVKDGTILFSKILLSLLACGGILTVALIAPNVFGAFGRLSNRRGFFDKNQFKREKRYLIKHKYIRTISHGKDSLSISLTEKGTNIALKSAFANLKIKKPQRWDGIWRVVIFDIPDRHKWARDGFRSKLKEIGFYRLQESVFVYPYPCEEEVAFLVSVFSITAYTRLIKTQHLHTDTDIRTYFEL